jgi:ribosomal-protein-alanine N-acetyltransferase
MKYLLTGEETERLSFRLVSQSDFDAWLPLFSGHRVAEFLGMDENLTKRQQCEGWFTRSLGRYEKETGGMNVLISKTTGSLVGMCGLLIQELEGESYMEVGYSILPEYWGKGYATEAAVKCKNYAFENNFTESLISMVHADNIGSELVARKNGMKLFRFIPNYMGQPMNIFKIEK